MLSRSITTTTVERAGASRRQRRRSVAARRPYCGTNGCASFLELDEATGTASCPVCGFRRQVH
jgi:DNA-directed RNA polymerase subunit RPC12/RpoP